MMDYRGGRMSGPPPHNFRPGRGGRGSNHHIPSHPHQPHHPPQGQPPRIFAAPAMNQPQWSAQSPINHAQPEAHFQQPYQEATFNNYQFHPATLPSPELMTSTPQPQTYTYPQQMFQQQQLMYVPADPNVYPQSPIVTPPPMVPAAPLDPNPMRKTFHFNSKDNVILCSTCGHRNILAETEFIKRDEKIDALEKENMSYRKEREALIGENQALRMKLEALQAGKSQEVEVKVEPQGDVKIEVENSVKTETDSEKKPSQLSPDAAEFSPKQSGSEESMTATVASTPVPDEVPVVSAKGAFVDEDGDSSTVVQGSEAGTQVEECLFEDSSLMEVAEMSATESKTEVQSSELPKEDSDVQPTLNRVTSWSDEVDQVKAQEEESFQESKAEDLTTEPTTAAAEEKWDEGHQTQSSSSTTSQNWRAEPPQQNANPDHWQKTYGRRNSRGQNRYRGHQQPPGFGRGRPRNDQEQQQFNDNFRPNQQHGDNYRSNQQHSDNYRPNQQHSDNYRPNQHNAHNRGYHHNQAPRYQKAPEENWDNQRDQGHQKLDNRNRNQRYGNKNEFEHPQQGEMRENRSRERENRQEKSFSPKRDERVSNANDSNDRPGRNAWNRDSKSNRESESKDMRDSTPQSGQAQSVWTGKSSKLFNNDDSRGTSVPKSNQNQHQGGNYHYNKGRQQYPPKPEIPDVVQELQGDLFSCPGEFSLAHCVAEDFRMGSGIAVKFKEQFKRVGELLDQNVKVGGCAHLYDKESERFIFYLVTKEVSNGKPKIESLQASLRALKDKCLEFDVKKLAMPRIGCGLDKLDWGRVKASINETFHNTDIEVRIYDFNVSPHYYKRRNKNSFWYSDKAKNSPRYFHQRTRERHEDDLADGYGLGRYFTITKRKPKSESSKQVENENWNWGSWIFTQDGSVRPTPERNEYSENISYPSESEMCTNLDCSVTSTRRKTIQTFEGRVDYPVQFGEKNRTTHEYDLFDKNKYDTAKCKVKEKRYASEVEEKDQNPQLLDNIKEEVVKLEPESGEENKNVKVSNREKKIKKKYKKAKSDKDKQQQYPDNGKIKYETESDDSNHNDNISEKIEKLKNKCKTESNKQNTKYSDKLEIKERNNVVENDGSHHRAKTSKKSKKQKKKCKTESDEDNRNSMKSEEQSKFIEPTSESNVKGNHDEKYSQKVVKRKRSLSKLGSEEDNPVDEYSLKTRKHKKKKKRREKLDEGHNQVEFNEVEGNEEENISHEESSSKCDLTDDMPNIPHEQVFKKQRDINVSRSKWKVSIVSEKESSPSARNVHDKAD